MRKARRHAGRRGQGHRIAKGGLPRVYERRGVSSARVVLYNEIMLQRSEATVIEHLILGAFLVVPLLIVAFLFSDELWQEHRQLHDMRPTHLRHRRIDWRHPLRRSRSRHHL
jgi:hypothetical protein